jgi:predicted ribosomally synthesized peptide with SipW-like signal peptide
MKRILLSVLTIGLVGAGLVGATRAYFSDVEKSSGNTFTTGSIDLKIDNECHWNGGDCNWDMPNWTEADLGAHKFFLFDDLKPGDYGEDTISLHVYDNDAWARFIIDEVEDEEVSCTEPEIEVEPNCVANNDGELRENLIFRAWLDQGSIPGFQGKGQDEYEGDNIWQEQYEPLIIHPGTIDIQGETYNIWEALAMAYTGYGCSDPDGDTGGGSCHGLAQDGHMLGSVTYYFGLAWELPVEVGNEVQTDRLMGDMTFEVVQYRNNPNKEF